MAQPIADKTATTLAEAAQRAEQTVPQISNGETTRQRIRRETATVILAGFASASRGGGLDSLTDSAIEWTDFLLEKLSRS